jgi:hypothetical protein
MKLQPVIHPCGTFTPIQPFPIEGKGSDPLLPSMGRIQEGCSVATSFSKELAV